MAISRVIIRVIPFKALIPLLITYLLSPLPLQVLCTCTLKVPLTLQERSVPRFIRGNLERYRV